MHSRILLYVLIAAAWIVFAAVVATVQHRAQEDLEEPRVSETAEPPDHLEVRAA
jgi:hypothetical protein